jgi:putative oxidoreductase
MGVLMGSPFMSIIGVLEILCGVALLLDKYVPLALIFLIAILFVAFLFHFFYDRANAVGSAVFMVLCLALVYSRKERFASILSA